LVSFPDIHATTVHVVADGDKVASVVALRGTHQGELSGLPPTAREVNIRVVEIFRVASGQIAERWGVVDQAALMKQLGAVPQDAASDPIAVDRCVSRQPRAHTAVAIGGTSGVST
jgi:hypothetical protein